MAWRKPTTDDLITTLSSTEVAAYRRLASQDDSGDGHVLISRLLESTAELVRSYCRSHGNIRLSPEPGTIPESLMAPAMDYAAFDLLKRMPLAIAEARTKARDDALRVLRDVADGRHTPESHGAPPDAASGKVSIEIARQSRRRVTAEKLEGL